MADWAALDVTAAVAWMRERYHDLPLNYVGHSFGGQALGLLANNGEVSRALLIAAQAGYWKLMASPERYRVYAFMNYIAAPLTRLLGYAPGWSGLGEDLPKGVYQQWASWVMSKHYLFDDARLISLKNFPNYHGTMRALLPLRRSLGDAAGGRNALRRLHRNPAGNPDRHAGRRRHRQDRPFRLLPPRAPRHAMARRGGMDPGGIDLSSRPSLRTKRSDFTCRTSRVPRTTASDRPRARALRAGRVRGGRYWCPRPAPRICRRRCAATAPRGRSRNRWR